LMSSPNFQTLPLKTLAISLHPPLLWLDVSRVGDHAPYLGGGHRGQPTHNKDVGLGLPIRPLKFRVRGGDAHLAIGRQPPVAAEGP